MVAAMVGDTVVIPGTVATDTETDTGPVVERVGAWVAMGAEATAVGVAGIIELGKLADAPPRSSRGGRSRRVRGPRTANTAGSFFVTARPGTLAARLAPQPEVTFTLQPLARVIQPHGTPADSSCSGMRRPSCRFVAHPTRE